MDEKRDPRNEAQGPDLGPADDSGLGKVFQRMRARRRSKTGSSPPSGGPTPSTAQDPRSVLRALAAQGGTQVAGLGDKYRIDTEIGAGGVGVVYRGTDAHLGREVALKFLHERYRDNQGVVTRFLEEAQIGGQLQHPGIVPVHDVGIRDGQLFFAMRMIRGRALADLLAERGDPTQSRGRLLKVFDAVCQTLAYAHNQQVIHRDLKPTNIMVGEFGEVQVVDWGMAKVLHATPGTAPDAVQTAVQTLRSEADAAEAMQSLPGSVLGTPEYMPPEQARGQVDRIDARADVFALGAILLEILTGAPPYAAQQAVDRLELARRCDLSDAYARLHAADLDLDLREICEDCLRADADARPADAGVLATRMAGYLNALESRAESARLAAATAEVKAQEERKARRLTAGLAASAVCIVLLVAGGWIYSAQEQARRQKETDAALIGYVDKAQQARQTGEWRQALAAMDAAASLLETGEPSPAMAKQVRDLDGQIRADSATARAEADRSARRELLRQGLIEIRLIEATPALQEHHLRFANDFARAFSAAGLDLTQGSVDAAVAAARDLGHTLEIVSYIDQWAYACYWALQKRRVDRLVEIQNRLDPDPRRSRLRRVRFRPVEAEAAELASIIESMEVHEQIPALRSVAQVISSSHFKKSPRAAAEALVAVHRNALDADPQRLDLRVQLAEAMHTAGPRYFTEAARQYAAAVALRPESVELRHRYGRFLQHALQEHGPARAQFLVCTERRPEDPHLWWHLAGTEMDLGNQAAAQAAAARAEAAATKTQNRNERLRARRLMAQSLWRSKKFKESETLCRALLKETQSAKDEAFTWSVLGSAMAAQGRHEEALPALQRALAHEPESAQYNNLGLSQLKLKRPAAALVPLREALELDPKNGEAWSNLGLALADLGRTSEAIDTMREGLEQVPFHARLWFNLGCELVNRGEYGEAVRAMRRAKELGHKEWRPHFFAYALELRALQLWSGGQTEQAATLRQEARSLPLRQHRALHFVGTELLRRRAHASAAQYLRRAVQTKPDNPAYRYDHAIALAGTRRHEAAIRELHKAVELKPDYAEAWCNLGANLSQLGRHQESFEAYRRGHEIGSKREDWPYPDSGKWVESARARAEAARRDK